MCVYRYTVDELFCRKYIIIHTYIYMYTDIYMQYMCICMNMYMLIH